MYTVPKPYPKEFRDDVVRVARNREPGQLLKTIAADFGISESCLTGWMKSADVEDGTKPGTTTAENTALREARKRIRLPHARYTLIREEPVIPQAAVEKRWLTRTGVSGQAETGSS